MRFLLVLHEADTALQNTLDWLRDRGHTAVFCRLYQGDTPPESSDAFDAVIIHGGAMNVDQEDQFPWLSPEKEFIRRLVREEKKLLGICLGAQLIAESLGARASRHPHWEIGWFAVETVLQDTPLRIFQWHGYSFDPPPGARLIATGQHWKNQGYALGSHVAAFQFHPEATEEWIRGAARDAKPEGTSPLVQNEEEILQGLRDLPAMTRWYFRFLDSFFKF